ncbi:MAG: protoheme IX farnesyltransferase [Bdellovibrionaceae bacterium]|nr:protoheme IX farnesyltransferase [Pseudobdellovibrionaceae bacterium]
MFKVYAELTKFGIVVFVIISGLAGYATGFVIERPFDPKHLLMALLGLYFLSSGSLALNQVQEWRLDQKMPRTAGRPIASGKIKPAAAAILAFVWIWVGLNILFEQSPAAGWVGLVSTILYNGLYTIYLKPKWIFAAVPGAVPGALPVTIGYAAANPDIFNSESIYLFLIMFLWQMPHFWTLAIRYREDYGKGGVPTLPVALGVEKTIYHIGLYTLAYVGVALAAPLFVHASWAWLFVVFPLTAKILLEFRRFQKSNGQERGLAFFLWLNVTVLVFLFLPVIDKWSFLVLG